MYNSGLPCYVAVWWVLAALWYHALLAMLSWSEIPSAKLVGDAVFYDVPPFPDGVGAYAVGKFKRTPFPDGVGSYTCSSSIVIP